VLLCRRPGLKRYYFSSLEGEPSSVSPCASLESVLISSCDAAHSCAYYHQRLLYTLKRLLVNLHPRPRFDYDKHTL
jgi:hypothetical protein